MTGKVFNAPKDFVSQTGRVIQIHFVTKRATKLVTEMTLTVMVLRIHCVNLVLSIISLLTPGRVSGPFGLLERTSQYLLLVTVMLRTRLD